MGAVLGEKEQKAAMEGSGLGSSSALPGTQGGSRTTP